MRPIYNSTANLLKKYFNFDAHYFLKGGFWLTLAQAVLMIGGLVTSVLFAKYLSQNDYGTYRYLIGLVTIFSAFSLTGLSQAILQTAAKGFYNYYLETIRLNFIYSLSVSAISIAGAIYYFVNHNLILMTGCLLIALLQPLIITFGNTIQHLQGKRSYKESTIVQICKTIIITISGAVSILLTNNILLLFFVFLISQVISNYATHILYRPKIHTETPKDVSSLYKKYALHTSARNIISGIASKIDSIILFTQLGAVELAIYSVATIIPERVKTVFRNLANLLLPKYVQYDSGQKLRKAILKKTPLLLLILSVISVLYIISVPFIYKILFPLYPEAVLYSQISALAFPAFVFLLPYNALQSQLENGKLHKVINFGSAMQIVLTILSIYLFGIIGAIITKIIIRYYYVFLGYYYLNKI